MGYATLTALLLASTLAGASLVSWLVLKILRSLGGTRLATRYAAVIAPEGMHYRGQTIAIGAVRYRHSATLVIGPAGLYLNGSVAIEPLLLPWSEVRAVRPAKIFLREALQLSIGEPELGTVTVYPDLFEPMRPYLAHLPGADPARARTA